MDAAAGLVITVVGLPQYLLLQTGFADWLSHLPWYSSTVAGAAIATFNK